MILLNRFFLPLLIPISWIYGLIILIRNLCYNFGLFTPFKFDVPIISVGNITMGGTGKTPLVIYIAKLLINSGKQPGIVSRGYGRYSKGTIVVHDGVKLLKDVRQSGDEPYLISKELNNTPVIVSKCRKTAIQNLLKLFAVDIIIMDDAFQHRKVYRNLDIITISSYDKASNYHMLPWGVLREHLGNIKRAQQVIYTKTDKFNNPIIHNKLRYHIKDSHICSIIQPIIIKINKTEFYKTNLKDARVFAFCGIGTPESFFAAAHELELTIIDKRIFHDHKQYTKTILEKLSVQIKNSNCEIVITTEKDMVKLPRSFIEEFEFYIIKINIVFNDETVLMKIIEPALL